MEKSRTDVIGCNCEAHGVEKIEVRITSEQRTRFGCGHFKSKILSMTTNEIPKGL